MLLTGLDTLRRQNSCRRRRRRRRRDVSNDVVDESKVFSRQLQRSLQLRIEDLDPVALHVDDDVGDAAFLLEQDVRRADDVTGDARLRQSVDVGERQVGMTEVAAGENL